MHRELAHTPVIVLTARTSETNRIVGLELGANDYIVKPFFIRELIARIKIQFGGQTTITRLLNAARLELDRSSCQVRLGGLRRYGARGACEENFHTGNFISDVVRFRRDAGTGPV